MANQFRIRELSDLEKSGMDATASNGQEEQHGAVQTGMPIASVA